VIGADVPGYGPTGNELAGRLRELLPDELVVKFDADLRVFQPYEDDDFSVCGVLSAFSWSFDRCIAAGATDSIRSSLAVMDELLAIAAPKGVGIPLRHELYDAVITCFVENVLSTTKFGHPLVVANLGPKVRELCERFRPEWLLPDPHGRLAT
jgi:hypothetical protein